jgi:hypothetical protein
MVLLAVTIGHCSAFGGRCPSEPPALLDDDAFGTAAFGAAIAVGIPMWLVRPTRTGFIQAFASAVTVGLLVGLVVRAILSG